MESKTVPLHELVTLFLARNPPKTRQDRDNTKTAFMLLLEQFPDADTSNFTANQLLIFRNNLALRVSKKTGKIYSVEYCNKLLGFVKAVFKWGTMPNTRVLLESDLIPPLVTELLCFSLSKVPLLQPGEGRQNAERSAVPEASIEAVLPHLPPVIADILRVQLLTGMRPGEVCKMRAGDLRTTREEFGKVSHLHDGEMWLYVMTEHKTARKVGTRAIPLGAEEQEILGKYISDDPAAPIWRNQKGRMMSGAVYSNTLAEVIKEHGLPKFVPYQFCILLFCPTIPLTPRAASLEPHDHADPDS